MLLKSIFVGILFLQPAFAAKPKVFQTAQENHSNLVVPTITEFSEKEFSDINEKWKKIAS